METKTTAGLIPLPAKVLTPKIAAEWIRDWGAEYARALSHGLECTGRKDREAYGMLAVDLGYLLEACAEVLASGEPVTLESDEDNDHPRSLCASLARICATWPTHSTGIESPYHALARRIEGLMAEPFADGAMEPRNLRAVRGCA